MLKKLKPTIAIVDSGIGGVSVLKRLIDKYSYGNYIYFADNLNMPYGAKSKRFIRKRIKNIVGILKDKYQVDLIILACNTASSCVDNDELEGVVCLPFNRSQTYFATPLTKKNLSDFDIIADSTLAHLIEKHIFERAKLEKIIKQHIKRYDLQTYKELTLACTHFELVRDIFKKFLPNTKLINNSENINVNFLPEQTSLNILFLQSKESYAYEEKFYKLLGR